MITKINNNSICRLLSKMRPAISDLRRLILVSVCYRAVALTKLDNFTFVTILFKKRSNFSLFLGGNARGDDQRHIHSFNFTLQRSSNICSRVAHQTYGQVLTAIIYSQIRVPRRSFNRYLLVNLEINKMILLVTPDSQTYQVNVGLSHVKFIQSVI
jgi:hypothetical protein